MSEWWTYTLSDFLLFSPRTYYRMIERHNAAVWPGHFLTLGLGVGIVGLLYRLGPPRQGRIVSAILALCWGCIAWAFLWERYAEINPAASWFAAAFAVEAVLLAGIGLVRGELGFRPARRRAAAIGVGLLVVAVGLYPLLAPLVGRGWMQAEVFGVAPDPTVIGTVGLLLMAEGSARPWLLVVPVLWCLISGATLLAMGSPEVWLLGASVVLVASARSGPRREPRRDEPA